MSTLPRPLSVELLEFPVDGHNIEPCRLHELLDDRTTILVFLRHYG
ncbi:MAG: hypothetical protein RLZ04_2110 [Actinomycetota bacterium]